MRNSTITKTKFENITASYKDYGSKQGLFSFRAKITCYIMETFKGGNLYDTIYHFGDCCRDCIDGFSTYIKYWRRVIYSHIWRLNRLCGANCIYYESTHQTQPVTTERPLTRSFGFARENYMGYYERMVLLMKLNELCILRNHYLEQVETLMREVGLSTTIAEKNQKIKLATEYTKRIGELDTMTKRILLKETKTKQIEEILKSIMNKIKTLFKKK